MENEERELTCFFVLLGIALLIMCGLFLILPHEPLFRVVQVQITPAPTPNVFHQILLEQSRVDSRIKLAVVRHELRTEWAWIGAAWMVIILGVVCFGLAFNKWLNVR